MRALPNTPSVEIDVCQTDNGGNPTIEVRDAQRW